ncbi:MAG: IS110 family transposase [Faecalibacterium prausnitzii]
MVCVGIDVAKDKHDCCILDSDGMVRADCFTIPNNMDGFKQLLQTIRNCTQKSDKIKVGLEATMAYEITMKSTISTAIIVLESEGRLEERYWNHLRVQNNILDFLYDLWVGSCHSLASDFSTIMKDLVEYDFIITESIMRERMQSA